MNLSRLINPGSIAVIGGTEAERVIAQCDALGFDGEIWPVNPHRSEIGGRKTVASVGELASVPDAAFVAVPRKDTIAIVRTLADRGCGGVVGYASGFAEVGEVDLQHELVVAAGAMPLLGPNCYGLINATTGVALWPDEHGLERRDLGAAIISQSGNMALNFTLQDRGVPLTHVVSLGNQAQLGFEDVMLALLDDARVEAIGLHIEGIRDAAAFAQAAATAHAQRVPVVVLKTGVSDLGAGITRTHTAALAGDDAAFGALFDRYGVYRVNTVPELLEVLKLLTVTGPISGSRLLSLSCSGGEASLVADRAQHYDVEFPALDPEHAADVGKHLDALVEVGNPLDYHTFQWGDRDALTGTFTAALSGAFDAAMLVIDFPNRSHSDDSSWWSTIDAMVSAAERTGTASVVTASLPETMPRALREHLIERGLAPMCGIDETLKGLEAASFFGARFGNPLHPIHPVPPFDDQARVSLSEWDAKQILADAGVPVPDGLVTDRPGDVAADIGFPVALKIVGAVHKSDTGGVMLYLESVEDVVAATRVMPSSNSYLVEQMIAGGVAELLVGVRRHDGLGWLLTIGAGGELTELANDAAHLLLPADASAIRQALESLSVAALLNGYRGRPTIDPQFVVDAIDKICRVALEHREFDTVEVNPLVVTPEGAVAVDAVIVKSHG